MNAQRLSPMEGGSTRPALVSVLILSIGIAAGLAVGAPAAADWIVMTDGTRVETHGPWQERGRMIVFTTAGGTLGSLRAADVDLDASAALTREMVRRANAPQASAEPAKRESVLRITDADVGHIDPNAPADGEEAATDSASTEDSRVGGVDGLAVASWERNFDQVEGVAVVGKLRNTADDPVRGVSLHVVLRNDAGTMVGRARARIARPFLKGSEETDFEAQFPGIYDFATADFRVDGTRPNAPAAEDASDAQAAAVAEAVAAAEAAANEIDSDTRDAE